MTNSLHQLYKTLGAETPDTPDITLTGITADSREVGSGYVFVAENGVNVDGHDFIDKAIRSGAAAVVCEHIPDDSKDTASVAWVVVPDSTEAMGKLASWWYGYPSESLTLVGVTGTNGKTTIATLLYEMARLSGHKAGLISTVVNIIDTRKETSTHTTPHPLVINRLMHDMVKAGCTFCAMEVSSHACAQRRIASLDFDGGIFTNLTRDHLDYHKTFDAYLRAKKSFFDGLKPEAFALTNADDRNGEIMLQNCKARRHTYSIRTAADYHGKVIESRIDGMLMAFNGMEVETAFVGRFNASNLTAVYGASCLLGLPEEDILKGISLLVPVAGRMQTLHSPSGITAIVDYAHTPDALANVLSAISDVAGNGRIITVAGAGGDRDKGKRPLMAAEAVKRSSIVVLTSDNPRHEKPEDIIDDMLAGVSHDLRDKVITIIDRKEAITKALSLAHKGDVVLIAGKGHETYQIIGDTRHHFDDREIVSDIFAAHSPQPCVCDN